jgi:choline dehydrogenase
VALIEAGERPPEISALPIAPPVMQLNPATDWMFTADPGKAGLGLNGRRVPVPRGKMLGGSSGINYMMYVRGHPADFDAWAAQILLEGPKVPNSLSPRAPGPGAAPDPVLFLNERRQ